MNTALVRKYFFFGILTVAIVLSVLLFWPFLTTVILGAVFSVALHPLYKRILRGVKYPWLASLITVLIFLIVLCVPLFFIGSVAVEQAQNLYSWLTEQGTVNSLVGKLNEFIRHFLPNTTFNAEESVVSAASKVSIGLGAFFAATLSTLVSLLLMLLSMFYFLKDGSEWKKAIIRISPLTDDSDRKIIEKLKLAINGIIKGHILIALAQGLLMGLGLYIFGVPHAALWGIIAGITSMVPTIGTAIVSIPTILFLFLTGHTQSAIGLLVWAAVLVGTIDNILNPLVIGRSIDLHPLLVLFSVLGGIALMGPVGIIFGPLIVSFLYVLTSVYKNELAS